MNNEVYCEARGAHETAKRVATMIARGAFIYNADDTSAMNAINAVINALAEATNSVERAQGRASNEDVNVAQTIISELANYVTFAVCFSDLIILNEDERAHDERAQALIRAIHERPQ